MTNTMTQTTETTTVKQTVSKDAHLEKYINITVHAEGMEFPVEFEVQHYDDDPKKNSMWISSFDSEGVGVPSSSEALDIMSEEFKLSDISPEEYKRIQGVIIEKAQELNTLAKSLLKTHGVIPS